MHECNGSHELRTARLQLALHDHNSVAAQQVIDEIGECSRCLRAMMLWQATLLASFRANSAGGDSQASQYVLAELVRLTP